MFVRAVAGLLAGAIVFALPGFARAAADGKTLFAQCTVCHGAHGEGNRRTGAPNIAGMDAWYVQRQLDNFVAGRRGATAADTYGSQMRAAVAALSDATDRRTLAAYVGALPRESFGGTAPVTKTDSNNGRTQYNALCSGCHQANGMGNPALGAPRLAGIDALYLARQYVNFRTALRGTHPDDKTGKQMAAISKLLPDAKAERDTLAYIATLIP